MLHKLITYLRNQKREEIMKKEAPKDKMSCKAAKMPKGMEKKEHKKEMPKKKK